MWVQVRGLKLQKYEDVRDSKVGSKEFQTEDVSKESMAGIQKRITGFAPPTFCWWLGTVGQKPK